MIILKSLIPEIYENEYVPLLLVKGILNPLTKTLTVLIGDASSNVNSTFRLEPASILFRPGQSLQR